MPVILQYAIAAVWLANGLWCKVLDGVPRHRQIVARILGDGHAGLITKVIGGAEVGMAMWVCSSIQPKVCAAVQMTLVMAMNIIEFFKAKDLLLFGRINLVVAILFTVVIGWSSFVWHS